MEVIVNNHTPLTVRDTEGKVLFKHKPESNIFRLNGGKGNPNFIEYRVNAEKEEQFIQDNYIQKSIQGAFEWWLNLKRDQWKRH